MHLESEAGGSVFVMGSGPRAGLQLLFVDGDQIFHSLSQLTMWPTHDLKSAFLFLFWFLNHIFAQEMKLMQRQAKLICFWVFHS